MAIRKASFLLFASSLSTVCLPADCSAQTKDGAVLGGVAGAVIGGIVGHQNDETPEGALIGGAVGAIAGGILGRQQEQQRQIQYYQQQQAQPIYHQHYGPPVYSTQVHTAPVYTSSIRTAAPVRRPVCVADVITLVRSGVSETVIANHILSNGVVNHPSIDDVLTMHDTGVSDYVIDAMQKAPLGSGVVVTQTPVQSSQVIVHQEYQSTPVYVTRPTSQRAPNYYYQPSGRSAHLQPAPSYRRNF